MFAWLYRLFVSKPQSPIPPKLHPAVAAAGLRNGTTALRLLLEISNCWNEALKEAAQHQAEGELSPEQADLIFALLFREKVAERAIVPLQNIFDKVSRDFEELQRHAAAP
jgi:hypothetical protein